MKRRLMAVLMALVMTLSLLPVSAFAEDDPGISFTKSAVANDDGTYTITMEAYATGKTTTTTTKQALDIALVLDVSGSMDDNFGRGPQRQKKLDALKTAVNSFIDGVAEGSPESNISIVKFAGNKTDTIGNDTYRDGRYTYNYTQIVKQLTAVKTGKDELKTAVSSLKAAGATAADYGMEKAEAALATAQNPKVIVMFTDGAPNHGNDFDYEVATSVINKARTLKAAGTTIYTVGVFERTDNTTNRYMSSTSSNYPEATAEIIHHFILPDEWRVNNGGTNKGSYYKTASSASDLNNIFQEISKEISSAANANLNDKTTVVDTISDYFTLDTDNAASVKVYTADKTEDDWAEAVEAPESVKVSIDGKTVSVTGYDYAANYVHDGQGQKLIIKITVVPSGTGCETKDIPTNADSSTDNAAKVMLNGEEVTSAPSASIEGHAVAYDLAGGEKQSDFPTLYYPEYAQVSVTDKVPTKQGYDFTGWNCGDASASGEFVMLDEDITLVAQWVKQTIDDKIIVEVTGNHATLPYNGEEQSVSGYTIAITQNSAEHPYDLAYVTGPAQETSIAKGTDKGTYEMGLKKEDFQNTNADYTNVEFIVTDGFLTITPKDVTFTGKSDSREWTGEEQEITGITPDGLLTGDTYEGLSYSAKGTDAGKYDGVFSGDVVIKNADGVDVTDNYNVIKTPGVLTITDKTETVAVMFRIVNGTWKDGSRADKTATVTLTNGKGTLDEKDVPTGMQPDKGYTNGTWDVTPNTAEDAIKGGEVYTYSYEKIIPASFNPNGYIVKQMTGDEMPAEETFTVNVAPLSGGAGVNGTATLRTGSTNFVFPEGSSFAISEETIFMVSEDAGSAARVTYDDNVYQLKVTVKLNAAGTAMEIDKVYCSADGETWHEIDSADGDKLVITNSYVDPDPASFNPNGYIVKQMTGDEMPAEETFTVNVAPLSGGAGVNGTATLRTGSTNFVFPEGSSFAISEETIFMVSEDAGSAARVTYDDNVYQLKVTVKLNAAGTAMEIDKVYCSADGETWHEIDSADGDKLVITNSYVDPDPASFNPNGYIVKQMTGDEMPTEETFTVNVAPAAGGAGVNGTATLRTGSTNFVFPENSSFAISEETIFMVSEDAGSAARVTYDDNVYQLKVTVKLNAAGTAMEVDKVCCSADGETWHEIDNADGDKLVITNSYEAEIIPDAITIDLSQYIQKELKLTGDNRFTGATYTASVTPIIDGELGEAKTISVSYAANESGLKTFNGTLTFTESGTYRYEVRENIPANATGYDTSVYELLIIVTAKDGKLVATVGQKLAGDQSGELTNEPIVFHNTYNTGNATIIIPPDERPTLNTDDHYAYVMGYPDGTVRPMGNITRAEVATIFFRLLTDDSRGQFWATTNAYSDVKSGDWFNNAVSTLSNAGIISGYPDGTFRPNAPITRAEMAKVVALFAKLDKSEDLFNDIAGHWAEAYIRLAAGNGWIAGYPDGSFKPQQNITRAETMTMINRVLDRVPSVESHLLPYNVMLTFPDCQSGQWYYIAVQEATNSHTYERAVTEKHGDEQWIALRENRDWTEFEH